MASHETTPIKKSFLIASVFGSEDSSYVIKLERLFVYLMR
jgi:hypothetical protein